jgi:hypothetical protein
VLFNFRAGRLQIDIEERVLGVGLLRRLALELDAVVIGQKISLRRKRGVLATVGDEDGFFLVFILREVGFGDVAVGLALVSTKFFRNAS